MSAYYSVIEKLTVRNLQSAYQRDWYEEGESFDTVRGVHDFVEAMQGKLAELNTPMALGKGDIHRLLLTVDGATTDFSGQIMSQACAEALRKLTKANDIDLFIYYNLEAYESDYVRFIGQMRVNAIMLPKEAYEYMTYSQFESSECDCRSGGTLFKFTADGMTVYNDSDDDFKKGEIPEDAVWESMGDGAQVYSMIEFPLYTRFNPELDQVLAPFKQFDDLAVTTTFFHDYCNRADGVCSHGRSFAINDDRNPAIDDDGNIDEDDQLVTTYIYNAFLCGADEVRSFAADLKKLDDFVNRVIAEESESYGEDCCGSWGVETNVFVDISPAGPRLMKIDISGDEPVFSFAG